MSHFPAGQPSSSLAPLAASNVVTQGRAIITGNTHFASYSTTLNFGVGGTDPYLLFTTDANRGRFFPTHIVIAAVKGAFNGLASSAPVAYIGWTSVSNPYDNWVSNYGCQSILDNQFGAGQWDIATLQTWQGFKSAPPSTDVYINLALSGVANDVRTVTVFGIYTG
jgi:hypothetical protein